VNAWFTYNTFKREGTSITTRNCSKGSTDRFKEYEVNLPEMIKINEKNVCSEGKQCCEFFKGTQSGVGWAIKKVQAIQDYATTGGCPDITNEKYAEMYVCSEIWTMYNCNTYFSKGKNNNARSFVRPCYDLGVNYLSACKLFITGTLVAATFDMKRYDPETYLKDKTAAQLLSLHSLYVQPDRVCNPYSYFFPETAIKSESPTSGGGSSSPTSGSSGGASGGAGVVSVVFSFAVAAMM
jgi:hypothetical protein